MNFRLAVRVFDRQKPPDTEKVRHCLELATLATSSDMQLWELCHITQPELTAKIYDACLGQSATATAVEIVIFVTRFVEATRRIRVGF